MLAIKSEFEDCGMRLNTLDEAINSVRYIFSSLKAYKEKTQFRQMERHKNLKKSVIELFENILAVQSDDNNYTKDINELFAKQRLLLDEMNKKEKNNIIQLYNSFFLNDNNNNNNNNNDSSSNKMDIIKTEENLNANNININSNNAMREIETNVNNLSDEETDSDAGDISHIVRDKRMEMESSDDINDINENKNNKNANNNNNNNFYQCYHCGKTLESWNFVMNHYWIAHKDSKPFKCSYCDKSYTSGGWIEITY